MRKEQIDQYLARLEKRGQELIENPAKAQEILESAGIIDSSGSLTENYRSEDDGEKKSFKKALKEIRGREGYWIEKAKIDFASDLQEAMTKKKVSKMELASTLDMHPAYLADILRGDADPTIGEVARIAKALNCKLTISLTE